MRESPSDTVRLRLDTVTQPQLTSTSQASSQARDSEAATSVTHEDNDCDCEMEECECLDSPIEDERAASTPMTPTTPIVSPDIPRECGAPEQTNGGGSNECNEQLNLNEEVNQSEVIEGNVLLKEAMFYDNALTDLSIQI